MIFYYIFDKVNNWKNFLALKCHWLTPPMHKCQSRIFTREIFAQQFREVNVSSVLQDNATEIADVEDPWFAWFTRFRVPLFITSHRWVCDRFSLVMPAILHAIFPSCFHNILFRRVYFPFGRWIARTIRSRLAENASRPANESCTSVSRIWLSDSKRSPIDLSDCDANLTYRVWATIYMKGFDCLYIRH